MIPDFNEDGVLPQGIYEAELVEIEHRYAYNIKRKMLFEYLKKLINDLRTIGCAVIYLDGSYITSKALPGDIDICWENKGVDLNNAITLMPILWDLNPPRKEQQRIYHADIFPANIIESASGKYFLDFFQSDKNTGKPKGIIKIQI
jgi:hypothetical protein